MSRYSSGRIPVETVEIDQDRCIHSYGNSPCTAALSAETPEKCFNTIATCQDTDNYQAEPFTMRLCTDSLDSPRDQRHFPFLSGVKTKPGKINPGGSGRNSGPLGKRAQMTATFSDHPAVDRVLDPYYEERITGAARFDGVGYDPAERSTFWRKWRARNQYYMHRPMRYTVGYANAAGGLDDVVTRHYVITGFDGPTERGTVSITGKDVLVLAQRDKAEAPIASPEKLDAGIGTGGSEAFTLEPAGVGSEYPASGTASIGSELVKFTRSGDDITITGRGESGTEIESHDGGDTFQMALVFDSKSVPDILYTLLHDFSGIDDQYLDQAGWATEKSRFLPRSYSAVIVKPTEVEKLLGEMCEQMYFYLWFDEIDNLVKLRSIRPADEEIPYPVNEDQNTLADSVKISEETDEMITRVVINYAIANPAEGLGEPSNYRVTDIFAALEEEGEDRQRTSKTKTINSRWLGPTSGAAAQDLGERMLARYKAPPREIEFSVDAKDRKAWLADFITFKDRKIVTPEGLPREYGAQIMEVTEDEPGTRLSYVAQQFESELPADPRIRSIRISADVNDIVLKDVWENEFIDDPFHGVMLTVTVDSGVVIGQDQNEAAFMLENYYPVIYPISYFNGVSIELVVESGAYISGKGGDGYELAPGKTAKDGGDAIKTNHPDFNVSGDGTIAGGGGGGGGAQREGEFGQVTYAAGGGGGAGRVAGVGGRPIAYKGRGDDGGDGTITTGGNGGRAQYQNGRNVYGGKGGDLGQPGESINSPGGEAGEEGYYTIGTATFAPTLTLLGKDGSF